MLHNTSRAGPLVGISHKNLPKWKAKIFPHTQEEEQSSTDQVSNTHFYHRSKERPLDLNSKYKTGKFEQ